MTGTSNVPSVTVTVTFSPTPTMRKAVKLNVPAMRLALICVKVTPPDSEKLPMLFSATDATPQSDPVPHDSPSLGQ